MFVALTVSSSSFPDTRSWSRTVFCHSDSTSKYKTSGCALFICGCMICFSTAVNLPLYDGLALSMQVLERLTLLTSVHVHDQAEWCALGAVHNDRVQGSEGSLNFDDWRHVFWFVQSVSQSNFIRHCEPRTNRCGAS